MNLFIVTGDVNGENCDMIVEALDAADALQVYEQGGPFSPGDFDEPATVYRIQPTGNRGVLGWDSINLKDVTP